MEKVLIELHNVCKSFGDKVLFDNFNLTIDAGEFVVITGESGCGKTTLLNMIGGLEPVSKGKIIVNGLEITNIKNLKKKGKSGVMVEEALQSVGMETSLKQKVYSLSGGEQQRIALARLRLKNCQLILADEPTGSLDRKNGQMVIKMLHQLNYEGKTVLMVTHDKTLIQANDHIIRL